MVSESAVGQTGCALFDETHGQLNWNQTGFPSRQRTTNLAGVARLLERIGLRCRSCASKPLDVRFPATRLLVIPPATGTYDRQRECWHKNATAEFSASEICDIVRFVRDGGRLLAFAYRFGDSFTQTNLGQLTAALGCLLNDDAIVDLRRPMALHPLRSSFTTDASLIPISWAGEGVSTVCWRCMATFTVLPGVSAWPIVYSPGGRCISYNRNIRQISFQSLPIAVAGHFGTGRFALFGGPHAFETSPLGLLHERDNERLLKNVLQWLLSDSESRPVAAGNSVDLLMRKRAGVFWADLLSVDTLGKGAFQVECIERLLSKSQTFRALSRRRWAA